MEVKEHSAAHQGVEHVGGVLLLQGEPKAAALKCTKDEAHGGGTMQGWHKQLLESMSRSRFCMIVPGDTQSSERLTDAFVTGARRVASPSEAFRPYPKP